MPEVATVQLRQEPSLQRVQAHVASKTAKVAGIDGLPNPEAPTYLDTHVTVPADAGSALEHRSSLHMIFLLCLLLRWIRLVWWRLTGPSYRPPFVPRRRPHSTWTAPAFRSRRKPDWVIRELIHLKAWTPKLGCRRIADAFNRRHAADGVCVSKSHVARVLIQHGAAVAKLRRKLSRRRPADAIPRNTEWAMDLTTVTDASQRQHLLLGVLDAGTRACVALHKVMDKRSITVWRTLITLFHQCGIPKRIRVDNEASFNSGWLKLALGLLGVRIHTTHPHSPWQNGRIERLFRTFKEDFRRVAPGNLTLRLAEWRWVYNHARPHLSLGHRTPAEAWSGRAKATGEPQRISLWNGALRAYYFPD